MWGNHGMSKGDYANGTVIGGTDNGGIYVYDAAKLLSGSEALIQKMDKVSSKIQSLDYNVENKKAWNL